LQGRLDLFFLFMMVVLMANTVAFLMVAIAYEYKAIERKRTVSPSVTYPAGTGPSFAWNQSFKKEPSVFRGANAQQPSFLLLPSGSLASAASSSAMSIRAPIAAHSIGVMEAMPEGEEDEETGSEATGSYASVYGRSLAYQPVIPAMPAPFR
jgi:hypothetical protein